MSWWTRGFYHIEHDVAIQNNQLNLTNQQNNQEFSLNYSRIQTGVIIGQSYHEILNVLPYTFLCPWWPQPLFFE